MPWEFIIHGDPEAAVIDILTNYTPELPVDTTVSANLKGYLAGMRWVQVTEQGSIGEWPVISRPRIDFEVYSERRSVAHDIAQICYATMMRWRGHYTGFGLFLSDAKEEMGITRIPDKLTGSDRYVFALRLTTRVSGDPLTPPS